MFDWGERRGQTMVQKGLLNFFCGKLLLAETTTCLSICEGKVAVGAGSTALQAEANRS